MSIVRCFKFSLSFALSVVVSSVCFAGVASAYDAQVGWEPVTGAEGYELHISYDEQSSEPAVDLGQVDSEGDGTARVVVEGLPLGPTARFTVVAYDADRKKSEPSNEMVLAYADVAVVVDSDGDGLTDAEEDTDLDGTVDSGESDPNEADSDGDGVSDGDEIDAGTDPTVDDTPAECGNGAVEAGEQCDDANVDNNDGCLSNCSFAQCVPGAGGCDDDNVCTTEQCSEGRCVVVSAAGNCDDGLACTSDDSCSAGLCRGSDECGQDAICSAATGNCESLDVLAGLWIPAGTYPVSLFKGQMTAGVEYTAGTDADPDSDSLTHLLLYPEESSDSFEAGSGDEIVYTVKFPDAARWHMWGRFYYPGAGNDPNSFFVNVDDGDVKKFGNNRDFQTWHWDGDGESETRAPLDLGWLAAGSHKITIEKREADGDPPRLDVIFFTRDTGFTPDDGEAEVGLDACREKACGGATGTSVCGDATGNGTISIVDAWMILNAAVSLGSECSFAVCDMDGNDLVGSSDARRALEAAVGVDVELGCRPTLGFVLNDAQRIDSIEFLVDYSQSGIDLVAGTADPRCESTLPGSTVDLTTENDVEAGLMSVQMSFDEAISGVEKVVECRFEASENGALPAPSRFGVSVVSYTSKSRSATEPEVAATVVVP